MLGFLLDSKGPKSHRERRAIKVQTQNAANLFVFVSVDESLPTIEGVKNINLKKKDHLSRIQETIDNYILDGDFDENNTVIIQNYIVSKIEEGLKTGKYEPFNDAALAVISMFNSINHILLIYDTKYHESKLKKDMVSILVSKCPPGMMKLYKKGLPENITSTWPYLSNMYDAYQNR